MALGALISLSFRPEAPAGGVSTRVQKSQSTPTTWPDRRSAFSLAVRPPGSIEALSVFSNEVATPSMFTYSRHVVLSGWHPLPLLC